MITEVTEQILNVVIVTHIKRRKIVDKIFKTDLKKRKIQLRQIAHNTSIWKWFMVLSALMFSLGLLIILGIVYVLIREQEDVTMHVIGIFGAMAVCLACGPFLGANYLRKKAYYKGSEPFSGMVNGTLCIHDSELEYCYWYASAKASAAYSGKRALYTDEDKFIYKIPQNAIEKITIDEFHICNIMGKGTVSVPIWESKNDVAGETSLVDKFSFVTCFDDDKVEQQILLWSEK